MTDTTAETATVTTTVIRETATDGTTIVGAMVRIVETIAAVVTAASVATDPVGLAVWFEVGRPREPRKTIADTSDDWRHQSSAAPEMTEEGRRDDGRYQYRGERRYDGERHYDGERRFDGERRNNGERRFDGERPAYRRNYDSRDRNHYERNDDHGRSYGDRYERRDHTEEFDERPRRRFYRNDSQSLEERVPTEAPRVEPKKLSNDNAYSALESDDEEEDVSNMSVEQLRERAAAKNRKREEESRKALEARDKELKKVASQRAAAKEPAPETKQQLDLDKQWGVDLPPRYCAVTVAPLSEAKAQTVNAQVKQLFATSRCNEMGKFLEDCNSMDVRPSRSADA